MTALFWYKILFITQLLIAEILFFLKFERKKHFAVRAVCAVLICYVVAVLFPLNDEIAYSGWYTSLMFVALFFVSMLASIFVWEVSWVEALFCSITAYTVQHLSYELVALIFSLLGVAFAQNVYGSQVITIDGILEEGVDKFLGCAAIYIVVYLLIYGAAYLMFSAKFKRGAGLHLKNLNLLALCGLMLLIDIVLNAFIVYIDEDYNATYDTVTCIYNMLCCVFIFYIQYSMIVVKDLETDVEAVTRMLHQSRAQYEEHKENVDLINQKVHDLKYQIRNYMNNGGIDENSVAEIENMIAIYDSTVKTGNEVLDIILTEKSLYCSGNGITLTCYADCSELNFITEGNLYVLFGNMIDNAIEAVMQLEEMEKRYINLNVRKEGGFITIHVENYFKGELCFSSEGLPITTKGDTAYHGFGLKSIQRIVEQYGGTFSVETEDNIFRLNILFYGKDYTLKTQNA